MSRGRRNQGRGRGANRRGSNQRSGPDARPGSDRRRGSGEVVQQRRPGTRRGPDGLGGDVVEGRQAVRELLAAGRRKAHELLVADDIGDAAIVAEILDLAEQARVPITRTSRHKLQTEAFTDAPQGVIAKTTAVRPVDLDELVSSRADRPPFLLVLDGITDPGNLGAILRSAEVAGVTGVVLSRHRAVRLSPAAVKSAAGAVEHLDFALVGGVPTALSRLSDLGLWSIGLAADAAQSLSIFDMAPADGPVVLVFGSEGEGLSRLVRERCDLVVGIPQVVVLGSPNVAAAAAIACFEVVRRRA